MTSRGEDPKQLAARAGMYTDAGPAFYLEHLKRLKKRHTAVLSARNRRIPRPPVPLLLGAGHGSNRIAFSGAPISTEKIVSNQLQELASQQSCLGKHMGQQDASKPPD
jgi:hypothetical protein